MVHIVASQGNLVSDGESSTAWAQKDLLVCQTTFGSSSYGDPNTLRREKHLPAIFHGSAPQSQADPGMVLTSALGAWPLASAAAWCQLSAVGPGAAPARPRQGLATLEEKKSMNHCEKRSSYRDYKCLLRNYRNWVRHLGILVTPANLKNKQKNENRASS